MKKLSLSLIGILMAAALMISGCGGDSNTSGDNANDDKKTIRIATVALEAPVLEVAAEDLRQQGYEVELIIFDDAVAPNAAVNEGSADVNYFQHEPYLLAYNEANGTDLVMVDTMIVGDAYCLFSSKYTDPNDLPNGAVISIASDAANQARGLNVLAESGLITLDPNVERPTKFDVIDNPRNFEFIEMDTRSLIGSIDDVDGLTCSSCYSGWANLTIDDAIAQGSDINEFAQSFAVKPDDIDAQWLKDLTAAMTTDAVRDAIIKEYDGGYIPLF